MKERKWSRSVFATPWTVAYQAPPSMGFSRQEYWSRLPFPLPGDLPDSGIETRSPVLQADALLSEPPRNLIGDQISLKKKKCLEMKDTEFVTCNLL